MESCRLAMEVPPDNSGNMHTRDFLEENQRTTGLGTAIGQATQQISNSRLTTSPLASYDTASLHSAFIVIEYPSRSVG